MAEYTYDNILINPSKEGIESLIGKEVYFHNIPCVCLTAANKNIIDNLGILMKICKDSINPFVIEKESGFFAYPCIIEKKEEPKPKYMPFETLDEFIESYKKAEERIDYSNTRNYIASCGMWLRYNNNTMRLVTDIWFDGVYLGSDRLKTKWEELLRCYTFLDGSPCGKLAEEDK